MTAKISDLGVARILILTPLQISCMTQTPGTPAYMPPEVMVANPKYYDTSVDEFSYGIMMIHIFSGRWPEPQVGPNRTESNGSLIPVTEAERHEVFLQAIGDDHPLMDLIHKSINNLQLAQEREINKSLMAGNHELQSILSKLRLENATLQHTISELHTAAVDKDYIIQMKDALVRRKNSDLEAKNRALEEKDATISAMSEQITKIRDYLAIILL